MEQEWYDKMHQQSIESKYSDSWYPVGLLEWTDDIKDYSEAGTCGDDWVWMKQEDRDAYKPAPEGSPWGTPATKLEGIRTKYYWISIGGNPLNGNTLYMHRPWDIIELLRYLVCAPAVEVGVTERGRVMMGIPRGVRLKGMTEWILREDKKEDI